MYQLRLAPRAKREFAKLPRDVRVRVDASLEATIRNPLLGKSLKGVLAGAYSVYIWPYRIVYAPFHKEKTTIVLRIRHRKDAYR